jgi:hypothetical protein
MHEFRRHRAWCPQGRPLDRRRLDLNTDHGAFPVWEWVRLPPGRGRPGNEVHANAGPRYLGLSADLATALQSWADWHDRHQPAARQGRGEPRLADDDDRRRWRDEGATLARRLADETDAEVVYFPGEEAVMATDCPHCGPAGSPE